MGLLVQGIVSGIAHGAIYALVALGYSIIFSTMRMGHFAQGDFFMFGAFAGFQFIVRMNCPVVVSVFMSMAWTAALMLVVERVVYRPMYAKGGGNIFILILTLAMQYIVQGVVQIIWGYEAKKMPPMFGSENKTYDFFGGEVRISHTDLMIILICGALMLALALFMKHSKVGLAMSAVSMNRKAAQLMGVKLSTIIRTTYVLAATLAALAGVLMAPRLSVVFTMGTAIGSRAMTSAVMGGFGSMPGAMLGGVLMGIIETLCAFYISTAYREAFVFLVLAALLFWHPQGILGRRSITKV